MLSAAERVWDYGGYATTQFEEETRCSGLVLGYVYRP